MFSCSEIAAFLDADDNLVEIRRTLQEVGSWDTLNLFCAQIFVEIQKNGICI